MHFCPDVPHLLIGTKLDCRNDSTVIEKLRSSNQAPVTTAKVRISLPYRDVASARYCTNSHFNFNDFVAHVLLLLSY